MIKPLGRIVTRKDSNNPGDTGTIMCLFKGNGFFKQGRVYEIREVLGEITIVDVGPSWIEEPNPKLKNFNLHCNWGHDLSYIGTRYCGTCFLTKEERSQHQKD